MGSAISSAWRIAQGTDDGTSAFGARLQFWGRLWSDCSVVLNTRTTRSISPGALDRFVTALASFLWGVLIGGIAVYSLGAGW
jgi:hypothetical protein